MPHDPQDRAPVGWSDVRDVALVVVGIGLVVYEALTHDNPRTELLVLYASMMGLPAYLMARRNGSK